MISAEESRQIADRVKLEKDPIYQKTKLLLDQFSAFIIEAAQRGDTRYMVRLPKPDYWTAIPTLSMESREIFDIFQKYVAPKLRELGYVVDTDVDFGDYDILIRW